MFTYIARNPPIVYKMTNILLHSSSFIKKKENKRPKSPELWY